MTNSAIADRVATSTPGQARKIARTLTTDQLAAVDVELTRRAAMLGRPGYVTKAHAAIRSI